MTAMLLYLTRLALAALTWPRRRCEHLTAQALADAQQCPDLVEPPEETPIFEEIRTERILDAANARWHAGAVADDLVTWEWEWRNRGAVQ